MKPTILECVCSDTFPKENILYEANKNNIITQVSSHYESEGL